MDAVPPYRIEMRDPARHNRAAFSCGEKSLDNYISKNARKDVSADVAVCYVACPNDQDSVIAGYYTLNVCSVETADMSARIAKTSRNYQHIPGMLLGRLAVDQRFQGQKVGAWLLFDALEKVWQVHQQVGVKLIIVDALHERAADFYRKYGFEPFADQALHLYLPVAVMDDILPSS
jgi:predicted GNAT family N-acyltransferase